jgi:mannose-1-phosphate guanylyltransferase / mannose-6-phosphate isomerase
MIVPVILCGGGGSRLWPAVGPGRPKGLAALLGQPLLTATLTRCGGVSEARPLVVAAAADAEAVRAALSRAGVAADLLLEPASRDTAAAITTAALHVERFQPGATLAILPCDHHVGDAEAFRGAITQAADVAKDGRLVLLGVKPDRPSGAYGHIRPASPGVAPVAEFVEKPDPVTARNLTYEGCLWNAGVVVARADALLEETGRHAPDVLDAARGAVASTSSDGVLGPAFTQAPRIAFDRVVLEKTSRAWVLPVDFGWSDLGAWDAVAERVTPTPATLIDAPGAWVEASEGVRVAVVGVPDVIVVVRDGAVLVCARDAAQKVRDVGKC